MTENEISNFALEFNNLISRKNCEISKLITENKQLIATVAQFENYGRRLGVEDVRNAKRPVFVCLVKPYNKESAKGFWAIPSADGFGIISSRKSVYKYENYDETWYALSMIPENAVLQKAFALACRMLEDSIGSPALDDGGDLPDHWQDSLLNRARSE